MIIICDTRQKDGKHKIKHEYLEGQGFELEFLPLQVGDYMIPNGNISVDTKRHLGEVATNVFGEKDRFLREIQRAKKSGIKLVFLIEHGEGIKRLEDVRNWYSKYKKVTGQSLEKRMRQLHVNYGVDFRFCNKNETGQRIIDILTGGE